MTIMHNRDGGPSIVRPEFAMLIQQTKCCWFYNNLNDIEQAAMIISWNHHKILDQCDCKCTNSHDYQLNCCLVLDHMVLLPDPRLVLIIKYHLIYKNARSLTIILYRWEGGLSNVKSEVAILIQ